MNVDHNRAPLIEWQKPCRYQKAAFFGACANNKTGGISDDKRRCFTRIPASADKRRREGGGTYARIFFVVRPLCKDFLGGLAMCPWRKDSLNGEAITEGQAVAPNIKRKICDVCSFPLHPRAPHQDAHLTHHKFSALCRAKRRNRWLDHGQFPIRLVPF